MNNPQKDAVQQARTYIAPGATVPVDIQTTQLLVEALRELLAQPSKPDYAWPSIKDYESEMEKEGHSDEFELGWAMARLTNDMLTQMAASGEGETNE